MGLVVAVGTVVLVEALDGVLVEVLDGVLVEVLDGLVVEVVGLVVVVAAAAEQVGGTVIVLSSSVTAPFLAKSRPSTVALVSAVMLVSASIDPTNLELVPSVAELVTCQKTHPAWAPLLRMMSLDEATLSAEPA